MATISGDAEEDKQNNLQIALNVQELTKMMIGGQDEKTPSSFRVCGISLIIFN